MTDRGSNPYPFQNISNCTYFSTLLNAGNPRTMPKYTCDELRKEQKQAG